MSEATYVPILPDLSTFFKETSKGAKSAGEQAGRDFAGGMEREVKRAEKAVDAASKAQERAANRVANATAKRRLEEQKLAEVMEKGNAKQSEILAATNRLEKARRDEAASLKNSEKASADLASKQGDLAKKTDEAASALEVAGDKGEGFNLSMKDAALGAVAFVAAAGGVAAGLVSIGSTFDDAYDSIRIGTGASGEAFEGLKDSMKRVATESIGVGSDMGAISSTLADLNTRLGYTGAPLEELTTQFLQLQNMGVDADINDVTGALTQFGVTAEEAPGSLDMLFQISQATGRSITELTGNLSKSGPALQEFGFGLEESAGLLGALDKAGLDSEKTLGSMTKALGEFAKDGKDPQEALWGTISSIEELTEAGKSAEAIDLANSIFGAKGGAGFVAAVESGQFAYDDFLGSIGATDDTISGLAAETADFAEQWDNFKLRALVAVEPLASELFNRLGPALELASGKFEVLVGWVLNDLIPGFQRMGEWIQKNEAWIKPLAVTVGVLAGGYALLATQQAIMAGGGFLKWMGSLSAITKIQTGAQAALNVVMAANPIALVTIAVAALVAGLVYFFTQTETGRKIWGQFTTALVDGWNWLAGVLTAGWETIKTTVFDAWNGYVGNVQENWGIFTTALSDGWSWLKDQLYAGYEWVKTNVFDRLMSSLDTVKGWFSTTVDAIGTAWDKLRALTAKPVRFVVETVYGGIRNAWNKVASLVGLGELPEVPLGSLGAYASGTSRIPGYSPGRDTHRFWATDGTSIDLGGGEGIARPEVVRAIGPHEFDALNAAARMGGVPAVQKHLGAFRNGGVVESISAAVRKNFPGMTITSTYRNTNDHHGGGRAVDFSDGTDSTPGMRRAAEWFYQNYGSGLLELIHSPFGNNVKNGANVGDGFGFYGAGTMNAHRNHVHVAAPGPLGDPTTMVEQIKGFASGIVQSLRSRTADIIGGIMNPIIGSIPEFPGTIGGLPKAAATTLTDAVTDFIGGRADEYQPAGGTIGSAESWREMATAAMRRNGFDGDDPRQVNAMLAQIMSESGGNPGIAQQIVDVNGTGESAGVGLLQIIPGTFAAHRDPELPNDRRDPWANMNAALRYYKSRYGGDLTRMWGHGHGYHEGGLIGEGEGWIHKTANEPEMVLNPAQTRAFIDWMKVDTDQVASELRSAFRGGDDARAETARFLGGREDLAERLLGVVSNLGGATESLAVISKEISEAYAGGDWGYGELASVLGREDWAIAIVAGAARLGEIHRAVDAGVGAAQAVWAEQSPGREDWVDAGFEFLGMGDSLAAGLMRRGAEFDALVEEYRTDLATDTDDGDEPPADGVEVADSALPEPPPIDVPEPPTSGDADGDALPAGGGSAVEGVTVVVNLDGVEVFRERVEKVEDGVVEIGKELTELKSERRALDTAATVLLS